jgi:hypothetical protein
MKNPFILQGLLKIWDRPWGAGELFFWSLNELTVNSCSVPSLQEQEELK